MSFLLALGVALAQSPSDPPVQPAPYPLDFPVEPQPYPVQPQPYPVQPQPYPVQPQPYPVQPQPYPVQPQPVPYAPGAAPVFVALLQPVEPALQAEAFRLTQLLEADIATRYPVRTIRDVPPWPDYDAQIYMLSCPPGSYSGCALVCGDRVGARWTIGGTVSRGLAGGVNVDLVFIENPAAREVLAFGMALDGTNDIALLQGAQTILGKITGGAFDAIDLRAVDTNPAEAAKLDAAQRQLLADSVAELERTQGAVVRDTIRATDRVKVTKADVAAMNDRDDTKPWERVDMREAEYVRYRNSGKSLATWRRLRRGRFGELVGRVALGAGSGPFGQHFDGRYALDDQLQLVQIQQYQHITPAAHVHADFEAGFGVLPFLDIAASFATRNSQFSYLINQEKVGDPVFLDPVTTRAKGSWQVGARASLVPFPTRGIRPALHGGIAFWQGSTWQSFIQGVELLEPMNKLTMLLLQVGPGVELTASEHINVFVRALADVPVGGNLKQSILVGGPGLSVVTDPTTLKLASPGLSVQAGIVGRLALFHSNDSSSGSMIRFEDEEP